MGWTLDDLPEHEGHVVAVVREPNGYRWRELGTDDEKTKVDHIQVGCECGWRSRRIIAPLGTEFLPVGEVLELPDLVADLVPVVDASTAGGLGEEHAGLGDGTLLGFVLKHDVKAPAPLEAVQL